MRFDDLDEGMQEVLSSLRHGSNTIECDVKDAMEEATTQEEFVHNAIKSLEALKNECDGVISELKED